jgi:GNAT superfamily N-acetyltransferase
METSEPRLIEITDPDSDLARQAFEIYEASFPIEERDPVERIAHAMRRKQEKNRHSEHISHFLAAVDAGRAIGLVMYSYYKKERLGFLFYMATDLDLRGQGLGSWMFKKTMQRLEEDAHFLAGEPPLGMFWEVERPLDAADEAERILRERRIRFYQRNGAVLMDWIDFTAPPLDEDLPPVPYYLMFRSSDYRETKFNRELVRAVIDSTLLYGYGVTPDSEYYKQAIASLD